MGLHPEKKEEKTKIHKLLGEASEIVSWHCVLFPAFCLQHWISNLCYPLGISETVFAVLISQVSVAATQELSPLSFLLSISVLRLSPSHSLSISSLSPLSISHLFPGQDVCHTLGYC